MIVDALVGFGYPFSDLRSMTFTDLAEGLDVALERVKRQNSNGA